MTPETISVARILQLRVPIGWQEAVEVAVCVRAVAAADRRRITLESCLLSTKGSVELTGHTAGSRDAGMSPLQLLRAMLDGQQAPAELRALAMAEGSQGLPTASDSATGPKDLSWFALPNGAEEIARLAVRALAAAAEEGTRSALDRLRSEASNQPVPDAAKPRTSRRLGRWAGIGLAGVAATGAFWVATRDEEKQWTTAGADLLASAAALIASAPASADVTALASASKPETPQIAAARPSRRSRPALRVSQVGDPYLHAEDESLTPAAESPVTPPPDPHEAAAPAEAERASAPVPVEGVFSAADMSVEPPTLVYPQLRSEPSVEGKPLPSTIELTVDPSGRVLRVRLEPGHPPTVYDRMLVSAAKAWQFKPAMRDGQPVTYVLRVPVTR